MHVLLKQLKTDLLAVAKEAEKENWDGYGASIATSEHIEQAFQFADLIPSRLPLPEVAVDPDGELSFEWYGSDYRHVVSVSVSKEGRLAWAASNSDKRTHGSEQLNGTFPQIILEQINSVCAVGV